MKSKKLFSLMFALMLISTIGFLTVKFQTRTSAAENTYKQELYDRIKSGLGTEIKLASPGASENDVTQSVETMAAFVNSRAGVQMSDTVKSQLVSLENDGLNQNKGISASNLVDALTTILLNRAAVLSDRERSSIATSLCGFQHPDLPADFKAANSTIHLRAHNATDMTPAQFIELAKSLRDPNVANGYRNMIAEFIRGELYTRLDLDANALPEKFGAYWDNASRQPAQKLSPEKAFLLSYSIIADDLMSDSAPALTQSMQRFYYNASNIFGNFPSPQGLRAFGPNGYFRSTPTDILFDSKIQTELVKQIGQRMS